MRITLIGPAFPWRGGIPLLVTDLAHRLAAAGHRVRLRTWTRQGPARWLPAQRHPLTDPECAVFPTVAAPLSWRNPRDWWRTGNQAGAESDLVVLVFYTTVQALALTTIARRARTRARVVLICANAVPHEPRPADRLLLARLAGAAHGVLVHTPAEYAVMTGMTDRPVAVAALPPHLPRGGLPTGAQPGPPRRRLLFFGKLRPYKGLDVLVAALARLPDVALTVVGELYPGATHLPALLAGMGERALLHPGYLPAAQIPALFASVDALVLPYRSATASQLVALAHRHGLPVVATRVGNFPETIRDGVDGLLCAPGDVTDLARALRELYRPGRLAELRAGVAPVDPEPAWRDYLATLQALASGRLDPDPPAVRPLSG